MNLVNPQGRGDLQVPPQNTLQNLFSDNLKREEVRRIVYDAFGKHLVIDPTGSASLRIRFSDRPPLDETEERGWHSAAVEFHSAATEISIMSDGIKCFTGIIIEFIAGEPEIILIDEPEAFLHPSLAYKLGNELSSASQSSQKLLFASTHSASFVMGCIQSGAAINIVRLTYKDGNATARVLRNEELTPLMRNPLLRSTGALNGLFYEHVVVTESDTDRAFYQEINERLLKYAPGKGIPNCLFLNAQNKQTVHLIVDPLRKLGIPAAAIVDIDIIKEGGEVWTRFLNSGQMSDGTISSLANLRSTILQYMVDSGKNMKREGGVGILPARQKEDAENLLQQMANYGLFVVPTGELESWMSDLGIQGHGPGWLIKMFERIDLLRKSAWV